MKAFLLTLCAFFAGVAGGMGMGGGTVLVPLLNLLGVEQRAAQAANLTSFLPMSVAALFFHFKNKLVQRRLALPVAFFAVATSLVGAFLAQNVSTDALRYGFAAFLLTLGVRQAAVVFKKIAVRKRGRKKVVYKRRPLSVKGRPSTSARGSS